MTWAGLGTVGLVTGQFQHAAQQWLSVHGPVHHSRQLACLWCDLPGKFHVAQLGGLGGMLMLDQHWAARTHSQVCCKAFAMVRTQAGGGVRAAQLQMGTFSNRQQSIF